jgi:hypothetical protein
VTPRSLDALAIGPPVCAELAVELAQAGPQFTQVDVYLRGFSVICVQNSVLFTECFKCDQSVFHLSGIMCFAAIMVSFKTCAMIFH